MTSREESILREEFNKGYKSVFQSGLLQGSKAVCKVIFDKANDDSKTLEERIEDIKKFCKVSLKEPSVKVKKLPDE